MQVFGALFSPFVRKVALVAAEKGIAIEMVSVNFADPSADFLAASPLRKIPALKDGDFSLADSTAIATYMEALHPTPPLLPGPPRARAKAIWYEEFADTILVPTGGPAIFNRFVLPRLLGKPGDEAAADAAIDNLARHFAYLDSVAPGDGWLAGDFSMGDIAVASVLRTLVYIDAMPDPALYPRIAAWYARVAARPAWAHVAEQEDAALRAMTAKQMDRLPARLLFQGRLSRR